MTYTKTVADSNDRPHDRKNRYILDLINAAPNERTRLINERASHPYNKELAAFKSKEAVFLAELKRETELKSPSTENKIIHGLRKRYASSEKKLEFYRDYVDLSFDAELEFRKAQIERDYIPEILDLHKKLADDLEKQNKAYATVDEVKRQDALKEIEKKTEERDKLLQDQLSELKNKHGERLISKKAYKNETKIAKRAHREDVAALSFLDDRKSISEKISNLKHRLKSDIETKVKVMESDIADLRRKTPIEVEKTKPVISYLTAPIPGLGQLIIGQRAKSIFFFLASIFIYAIAIPYALGFGNYQGTGISGIITLAENGGKLDRSIIFMIEGMLAIILLLIASIILILSFKDVHKTEKNLIKGIRYRTWFESKETISRDGFPYLVSAPALIIIIFIVLIPIFTTFLISFTNMDPNHQNKFLWSGFQNYALIFLGQGIAGQAFWLILGWTLIWTLGATTLAIFIGFSLALIANQERILGKSVFRTIYLLPWAVPAFITIMFFALMVSKNGPITVMIQDLFGITLDIKNDATLTRTALILLQGWLGSSYVFLLSTGVLQGIPGDLYEAADIDGAGGFQKTWKITIPLVLLQIGPLLVSQYAFNFNNFSIIFLFNGGAPFAPSLYGNLAGSSDLLISYIFKLAIRNNYQAVGAAITIVVSFFLTLFAYLGFRRTAAFKED